MKDSSELQKLSELNSVRFLGHLAGDWLAVTAGFLVFKYNPTLIGFLISSVILGVSQHALAVLGHEAVHYRISGNRFVNEWVGRIFCFFPVGITVSSYRDFHFPHHRNPGGENDPEIPLRHALGKNFRPPYTLGRALGLWVLSFVGHSLRELAIFVSMLPKGSRIERAYLVGYWSLTSLALYHYHALSYLGLWAFSLVSTYFSMVRFQAWYEHSLSNSISTNRYSLPSWLYRLAVPHNIWVHYEHHKYPAIPFYNLEKARALDPSEKIYAFDEMVETIGPGNSATQNPFKKAG